MALSFWRLCVHPKLWNYVSHWSLSSFKCLVWELVARWAAGRWEAPLCLMCSRASNGVYADRGEQQECPFLDRGSHTRAFYSLGMRVGCEPVTRQPLPLSKMEEDGLDLFCTRLAEIPEDSLPFSNIAEAFSRVSFPSSTFFGGDEGVVWIMQAIIDNLAAFRKRIKLSRQGWDLNPRMQSTMD